MFEKILFRAVVAAIVVGTAYRLFPVLTGQPQLSRFFVTEDGYLMLTIARNIAIGLGMTVADGTIATNGVQPLATFLFALPYLVTGGDKVTSLVGIHLISAAVALAGVFAVRAFAARVLGRQDPDPRWPWLVAGLWFLSPLLLLHTMNALETGLYTLVLLVTLLQFGRVLRQEAGAASASVPASRTSRPGPGAGRTEAGMAGALALGALCGLTFLARNDGVFLVTAIFGIWFLQLLVLTRWNLVAALRRTVPAGLLSLAVAAPWLVYNQVNFGSIVPISGSAQSLGAAFGQNATLIPAKIFEYLFPMLPVPGGIEQTPPFMAAAGLLAAAILGVFLATTWRRGGTVRLVVAAYLLHGVLLVVYYGLYFGAPHFMSRYLAPMAPLLIVATLSVLLDLARRVAGARAAPAVAAAGLGGMALSLALLLRLLLPGAHVHEHFQVVAWVKANVPEETWVGAIQTGTLGYWHDRTINLDGKVNPAALAARRADGDVLAYVTASEIAYLADWDGIAGWVETDPAFGQSFEVVVADPAARLGVLRRRAGE